MRILYKFQGMSITQEDDGSICFRDGERELYRGDDWKPAVSAFFATAEMRVQRAMRKKQEQGMEK